MRPPAILAVGDLHVDHPENREIVAGLHPRSDDDWLLVCGDVADTPANFEWALRLLAERFSRVIWVPGNHELHCYPEDSLGLRGEDRYLHLVELCGQIGIVTPEDPFPIWENGGEPVRVAPLFLLYDYSFGAAFAGTRREALRRAYRTGVVCVDEFLLHPDPYPTREAWCAARLQDAERRLSGASEMPTILLNHYPLVIEPTRVLRHPEFAQWCGTVRTADWHLRFGAVAVVYGHLHIPRTTLHDGVRFEEVSLGYPRERARRPSAAYAPRRIFPEPVRA